MSFNDGEKTKRQACILMREFKLANLSRVYPVCMFCSLGFSIAIVNWTFYFIFLSGCCLKCKYCDINMGKEAKESKELRLQVSSVDYVFKVG